MSTDIATVAREGTETVDDLEHAVCVLCYPEPTVDQKAICGAPQPMMVVTEHPDFSKPLCMVCVELARSEAPCRGCGL